MRLKWAFYKQRVIAITKTHKLVIFKALLPLEGACCDKLCFTLAKSNGLAVIVIALKWLSQCPGASIWERRIAQNLVFSRWDFIVLGFIFCVASGAKA